VNWLPYEASDGEWQTFEAVRPGMNQGWGGTMEQLTAYVAKFSLQPSP